jgi:hypothetical protein
MTTGCVTADQSNTPCVTQYSIVAAARVSWAGYLLQQGSLRVAEVLRVPRRAIFHPSAGRLVPVKPGCVHPALHAQMSTPRRRSKRVSGLLTVCISPHQPLPPSRRAGVVHRGGLFPVARQRWSYAAAHLHSPQSSLCTVGGVSTRARGEPVGLESRPPGVGCCHVLC